MPLAMEAKIVGNSVLGFDTQRGSLTIKISLKRSDPDAVLVLNQQLRQLFNTPCSTI